MTVKDIEEIMSQRVCRVCESEARKNIESTLKSYGTRDLYESFFDALDMKDAFVDYCIKYGVSDEKGVIELRNKVVLELFVRMSVEDKNYFKVKKHYNFIKKYWKDCSAAETNIYKFWDEFLNEEYSLEEWYDFKEELYNYVNKFIRDLKSDYSRAKVALLDNLGILHYKRADLLSARIDYLDPMEEFAMIYELYRGGIVTEEYFLLVIWNNSKCELEAAFEYKFKPSQELYDFLNDNVELYKKLINKDVSEYNIVVCDRYGKYEAYIEGTRHLDIYGKGKTEKQAINDFKKQFEKGKGRIAMDIINRGLSEYLEKRASEGEQ